MTTFSYNASLLFICLKDNWANSQSQYMTGLQLKEIICEWGRIQRSEIETIDEDGDLEDSIEKSIEESIERNIIYNAYRRTYI